MTIPRALLLLFASGALWGCATTEAQVPPQTSSDEIVLGEVRPHEDLDATPQAAENPAPGVKITMYITSWCPVCRKARVWLERRGYEFVEHDVEEDVAAAKRFVQVNPRGSVPMFEVDGKVLIGFSPYALKQTIDNAYMRRKVGVDLAAIEDETR